MVKRAALAAALGLAVLAPASHALGCPRPEHVSGFTVHSLNESGIGCHNAEGVARRWFSGGYRVHGYDCTSRWLHGRTSRATCNQIANSAYVVEFTFSAH